MIENLPGSLYWKNTEGIYLACNRYLKKHIGPNVGPVKGGTDHAAFPKKTADLIRENDNEVIQRNRVIVRQENILLPNGKNLIMLSTKKPFIDDRGNIAGVLGISIDLTLQTPKAQGHSLPCTKRRLPLSGDWSGTHLTLRQAECAYYLCRGKTVNEIASQLGISPRTVEEHLKQLKVKFACFKKSALIEILLSGRILPDITSFIL